MRSWLLLLIVGILFAIICMSQYADSAKNRYEEGAKHTKDASVTKGDDKKADNDTEKTYQPPVWAKFVTWPESVGAWAVILTVLAIVWQSVETRRAADAAVQGNVDARAANEITLTEVRRQANLMEKQANSMERQIQLQEATMTQWLTVQNWSVSVTQVIGPLSKQPKVLKISFEIVNESTMPLTMTGAFVFHGPSGPSGYITRDDALLLPRNPYAVTVGLSVVQQQAEQYMQGSLGIAFNGRFSHTGIDKKKNSVYEHQRYS